MRIILAFALPPLAVLLCGRPLHFVANLFLTACFWIPGVVHALVVVQGALYDKQTDRTLRRMESAIAEQHPEAGPALRRQRRRAAVKRFIASAAIALTGYMLSVGPASWLMQHGRVPGPVDDFIRLTYCPLDWLAHSIGWFGGILEWYRRMWTG